MKKLLSTFLSIGMLLIAQVNSFSQVQDSLIQLHPGIGDTLDIFDRNYFQLFQQIDGFEYAVFYIRDNKQLISKVTYSYDDTIRDTTIIQELSALQNIRRDIYKIGKWKNEKIESLREVKITSRNGEKYSGVLEMFSKEYMYLYSDEDWLLRIKEHRYKIKISEVDTVFIMGESNVLSSTGWGALAGVLAGAVIGVTMTPQNYDSGEFALAGAAIIGTIGGIIGLIVGLLSSTDDIIITINSQKDIPKLIDYAKYYFKYDENIEKIYTEIK